MAKGTDKETPLMKQYNSIKAEYPGAVLLFRVGDFYETFGEDARIASSVLGIVLTKRANGAASEMELAGFPHHSLDNYLPKLVRAGYRVAICDQLEDPKQTKTIVKRGVTELVTPGVSLNDKVLESRSSNYLASWFHQEQSHGLSFLDISTGEFLTAEGELDYILKLLQSFRPSEVLVSRNQSGAFQTFFGDKWLTQLIDDWVFASSYAEEKLMRQFQVSSLKGFGISDWKLGCIASGAVLHYLEQTRHQQPGHIRSISRIDQEKYLWLDGFTIRNLELIQPLVPGAKSLLDILDHTKTPMGARLLRNWIVLPLKTQGPIVERHECVSWFAAQEEPLREARELLFQVGDLQRLTGKVALARVNPRELVQLAHSLRISARLRNLLLESDQTAIRQLADQINPCEAACNLIAQTISEDAPVVPNKGGILKDGVLPELDELRQLASSGKEYLAALQRREAAETGITSLKVAFNNVFGYYIEVTHAHKDKVPDTWIRKQTLTNAERYITPELKVYEEKILNAEDRIFELEMQYWLEFVQRMSEYVAPMQVNAAILAKLDCLSTFAFVSNVNSYVRPQMTDDKVLEIKDLRHPVIEKQLPAGTDYIPNDILLDSDTQRMIILTGPNMSGKSAVLRQTALAVLMAQIGCFVPCRSAHIGLIDKVYTRVGASDNISLGESTFMVEMIETASILNNISSRSLVILDEIGRGTSTYDGISLAWSIAEFLAQHPEKPKTLFATHYHELNELESKISGVRNFHISIKEYDQHVVFLRKMKPGGSEHSFGIHVAKMAGIPAEVTQRAEEVLVRLEQDRSTATGRETAKSLTPKSISQLQMFSIDDPVLMDVREKLRILDINTLSPVEALFKLNEIKQMVDKQ
ncbi:MAG: mismatch repair protein MutS [Bacteroidota bacterium]